MQKLREALSFGGILSEKDIDFSCSKYHELSLKPGEDFFAEGSICTQIGFVQEGILRSFTSTPDGNEVTKYFIRPGQFAVDLESYYNQTPCDASIQATVPVRLFVIDKSDWTVLIETVPKLFIYSKTVSEASLLNKIKDNDFLNFGTATDKYREFVKRYPDVALQVPQQYIASYLKITPQSLSRIRKEWLKAEKQWTKFTIF
jgi:CRP-like cAMP-binding protein